MRRAQEYGKIRALRERAAFVTKQKNEFVVRVLTSYKIPHETNDQGAVVRINMDDKWLSVTAIEIVPSSPTAQTRAGRSPRMNCISSPPTAFWT